LECSCSSLFSLFLFPEFDYKQEQELWAGIFPTLGEAGQLTSEPSMKRWLVSSVTMISYEVYFTKFYQSRISFKRAAIFVA